ncbi:MAG: MarC family protein [Actinomycetaceae bacterium]|nr:MarC family protein [Actinomycetaceae bacterium]
MSQALSAFIDIPLLATTFTTLLVIMDPPGTIPVFMGLTSRLTASEQKRAARQATYVAFGVIVVFAILGQQILSLLQISIEALQLSGGVLLFLVAMELLMGQDTDEPNTGDDRVNVALVPLGTPLLAGPGAIVAVMVAVGEAGMTLPGLIAVFVAVLLAHIVIWATMRFSLTFSRLLGAGGILLLTKIAGLLLAAIATQLVMGAIFRFISSAGFGG